jgi:hypothetical protein
MPSTNPDDHRRKLPHYRALRHQTGQVSLIDFDEDSAFRRGAGC